MSLYGLETDTMPPSDDLFSLAGRVAVITGAASGIGQSVARTLAEAGARVAGLDLTTEGIPQNCTPFVADVRNQEELTSAMAAFGAEHGRVDVLVNNVAVSAIGTIEDGSEEEWLRILDINVLGQMRAMRAALPWLRKSESPSVVIMSSCSATNGIPQRALYSASKGAVHALAAAMAVDFLEEGIRVNAIVPGTVDTPFMEELIRKAPDPAAQKQAFENRQPTGRMVDPNEISLAVAYLASPRTRSVTGTTVTVDGGMQTLRPKK